MRKSIKESRVSRMRNLATGNYATATEIQTGYKAKRIKKIEGDVWTERGKTWTIKDGVRQNVTKLDVARELLRVPISCPKCDTRMKHKFDKGAWNLMKHCFHCHVKWETKMIVNGTREEFFKREHGKNFDAWIENVQSEYVEFLATRDGEHYVTEDGSIEKWTGGQGVEELKSIFNNEVKELKDGAKKWRD